MVLIPLLLVLFLSVAAEAAAVSATAPEWPAERQFELITPPPALHLGPAPSAAAETVDGSLLLRLYWPVMRESGAGVISERPRTRVVRIAPDGSRTFVAALEFSGGVENDDEILPLPDGSILFTRYNAIDRLLPGGSIVRFAGTGRFSPTPPGDGGPATGADIGFAHGLSRFPDGSVVFADGLKIRRVAPDGTITTIAGSGDRRLGDGGPATAAGMSPMDVLPSEDGGFLIADTYNGRVRRVTPDGVISTLATAAGLALPRHLAFLPDGSLLIGEWERIRQVAPDGTISTIFQAQPVHGQRLGDFAGRYGESIEAMEVTREGGIVVILSGFRLRARYLTPRETRRTFVALRDARVTPRGVEVTVDTTTAGRVRLAVRRRGKVVADASRRVRSGRQVIAAAGSLAAAFHEIVVSLRTERGSGHRDRIRVFTGAVLPKRLVVPVLGTDVRACRRIDRRRIDCEVHDRADEESGQPCLYTSAYRLFASGLIFTRPYGRGCHREPAPFDQTPEWSGPWRAWPAR